MARVVNPDPGFWSGRRVFLTGHTGFKGSWLSIWLHQLGAEVRGFALDPPTAPSLYEIAAVDGLVTSTIGDVRDRDALARAMRDAEPSVVLHLAAQPLVRDSYRIPAETWDTNVMGTVNVLEAVRATPSVRSVVIVTTDKCYENHEWVWGYREDDELGGYDPYSSSKAAAEIAAAAFRRSFFPVVSHGSDHTVAIATARAGNVIGFGDRAQNRLIPDIVRALESDTVLEIRNPRATRPWQHVLEPLAGYLLLAERLADSATHAKAWNFGPWYDDCKPVEWIVSRAQHYAPSLRLKIGVDPAAPHESQMLRLDISRAVADLGWRPRWDVDRALAEVFSGRDRETCIAAIGAYVADATRDGDAVRGAAT